MAKSIGTRREMGNLVVLKYASNPSYPQVVDTPVEGLIIDLDSDSWSYNSWKKVPIGSSRSIYGMSHKIRDGIIGVYDRMDTKHLSSLARAAKEFTESETPFAFSDGD